MFRLLLFSILSTSAFLAAAPQPPPFPHPLVFEPNRGQTSPEVKWFARGSGYQLFITSNGITMKLNEPVEEAAVAKGSPVLRPLSEPAPASGPLRYSVLQMALSGSRAWEQVTGLDPTGGVSNYDGRDGNAALMNVPHYSRLKVAGVYDGIDLVFYSSDGELEYDFQVAPGADSRQIRMAFDGVSEMHLDNKSGDLVLKTAPGAELRHLRPKVFQQIGDRRIEIAAGYRLLDENSAGFKLARYDHRRSLVIDPTVKSVWSFGGTGLDGANAIAMDDAGNLYVTGSTTSADFPVTNGSTFTKARCTTPNCGTLDVFVTKFNPFGQILFSSFGSSGAGTGIAVDSTGIYVTGVADEPEFSAPIFHGGRDIFVRKYSLNGQPGYVDVLGGSGTDFATAIAVDSQHNAWITGYTDSADFVHVQGVTPNVVLIAQVGPFGQVLHTSFQGAEGETRGFGITVDGADNVWITGQTCGGGFSTEDHSDQSPYCKVFVTKVPNPSSGSPNVDMVFGGSPAGDLGFGIIANGSNSAYVTGYTNSPAFPTTPGVFQPSKINAGQEAFVTEVTMMLAGLPGKIVRSTFVGGTSDTIGRGIAQRNGNLYVTGSSPAPGFLARMSSDLTELSYISWLSAHPSGLAVSNGVTPRIYVTGYRPENAATNAGAKAVVVVVDDDVVQSQVLWQNTATGQLSAWTLDGQGRVTSTPTISMQCGTSCSQGRKVLGALDSDHDGIGDVLSYNATTGELQVWLLNTNSTVSGIQSLSRRCGSADGCSQNWKPVGVGDFNTDGSQDVLWHNDLTGQFQAWLLNGSQVTGTLTLAKVCRVSDGCWPRWQIIAIGDFNSDGIDDLFWYDTQTGKVDIGMLDGKGTQKATQWLAKVCGPDDGCSQNWKPAGLADVNQDGTGDLLWENVTTGEISAWLLNGTDRILGTRSLSLQCNSNSVCSPGSLPVGILRNRMTP